jgi:hypothetical protein
MIRRWPLFAAPVFAAIAAGGGSAGETGFASSAEAMSWLAGELPRVTQANPKYLTKSDGTVSQWLTKSVHFSHGAGGHIRVAMQESYTQTKGGVTTPGRHEAKFSLADVEITDLSNADDVTPAGAPSRGILFTCAKPKPGCVAAVWGGKAAPSDKTDISIQDDASRAKVLAAFRYLQTHKA